MRRLFKTKKTFFIFEKLLGKLKRSWQHFAVPPGPPTHTWSKIYRYITYVIIHNCSIIYMKIPFQRAIQNENWTHNEKVMDIWKNSTAFGRAFGTISSEDCTLLLKNLHSIKELWKISFLNHKSQLIEEYFTTKATEMVPKCSEL